MNKQPLIQDKRKFDLNFLLVGNSGSGKSHLCGTYTLGPVHFYMTDRGGEKSLFKLLKARSKDKPLTIDYFNHLDSKFSDLWKAIQQDQKKGFFDEMAEKNGLVVLPDSITAVNEMAIRDIARLNNIDLLSHKSAMSGKDKTKSFTQSQWGQLLNWLKELIRHAQDLPCAVAMTAHLSVDKDKDGAIIERYPSVNGQFRYNIGKDFDEVYLLEAQGSNINIHFKQHNKFTAKSRVFSAKRVSNITMDELAKAYINNDLLDQKGGNKQTNTPKP